MNQGISEAIKQDDTEPAGTLCHQLKSTAATIGAMDVSKAAEAIEQLVQQQRDISSMTLTHYGDELERRFFEANEFILNYLKTIKI